MARQRRVRVVYFKRLKIVASSRRRVFLRKEQPERIPPVNLRQFVRVLLLHRGDHLQHLRDVTRLRPILHRLPAVRLGSLLLILRRPRRADGPVPGVRRLDPAPRRVRLDHDAIVRQPLRHRERLLRAQTASVQPDVHVVAQFKERVGLFPRPRERVDAPAFKPVEVAPDDRREVLRGGAHVQEHGQTHGAGDLELCLEPFALRRRVAELEPVVIQPALSNRHHPARLCALDRERDEGSQVRVAVAGRLELAASRRMHPDRREQTPRARSSFGVPGVGTV
mmetsp:Transcript_12710/g.53761  ORF Transcript_12710/g.53761 Transcript_12710/m.53761 type:complete len:280 (-) Transcript_12710:8030-8869(-)